MIKDYTGEKFGKLTLIERVVKKGRTYYVCHCDCGKTVTVRGDCITSGNTKSCGCKQIEHISTLARKYPQITHGLSKTRLYGVFRDMKTRCYNTKTRDYKNYGARGITICKEWLEDFSVFYKWAYDNGYDENAEKLKCTIDRIDNTKGYSPENCRWVSIVKQNQNKRQRKTGVKIKCVSTGEIFNSITEASKKMNTTYKVIHNQIKKGIEWVILPPTQKGE